MQVMENNDFTYGVGLKSNKETNDFLRCLWSRLAAKFGNLGWEYSPLKDGNSIHVGHASLADDILLNVNLSYKQRGCLKSIDFGPSGTFEQATLKRQLQQCVNEALHFDQYVLQKIYKGKLDKNLSFVRKATESFVVEDNTIYLKVYGYDNQDCTSMFKAQLQQVCNFLTYDTLRYITMSGTLTEEIRENHNFQTNLVDGYTGEVTETLEKNDMYRNLEVSDHMAEYINSYLQRPYGYEEHYTNFDKSVQFLAQGVRNEELSKVAIGLPEPYVEQAIVNYMSALEVITLEDREPELCEYCGQTKYSIARRVMDLAEHALSGGSTFAREYYNDRSRYMHTGTLFSSNSYVNRSIPLMSKNARNGMLDQVPFVDDGLKEAIKACIECHERKDLR